MTIFVHFSKKKKKKKRKSTLFKILDDARRIPFASNRKFNFNL